MGNLKDLKKLTLKKCRDAWKARYHAGGAIIALAGNVDFARVRDEVGRHFGDWPGKRPRQLAIPQAKSRYVHERQVSEQTHIGIAFPSIPETDERYYMVRVAAEILGGGTSSRLFTEVREKRALCYNVWAGYNGIKGAGAMLGYAGTSNDRAQKTLDCLISEIHRMSQGVLPEELSRAKTILKAATIMHGESTGARCGTMAYDYFMRGRVRTLEEIKREIDRITLDQVNAYLAANAPGPFTIVTVGTKKLSANGF